MTTNGTAPRPSSVSGPVLGDAARRMLPVVAGRLLAAVVDRAVEKVDDLADRLDERSGTPPREREQPDGSSGRAGAAVAFLLEQARVFLAFVVRIAAQALEALRRATERLRARRAPEGIDEAPAPEEILDDGHAEDDDLEDEYEDDEDGYDDEDVEVRATANA